MAHRVDAPGNVANKFVPKDIGIGQPGTDLGADWHNDVQENVVQAVERAGLTPVKGTDAAPAGYKQLGQAIAILAGGASGAGFKNLFVNGGFDLWQCTKNTPPSFDMGDARPDGPSGYTADQWFARFGQNGVAGRGTLTNVFLAAGAGVAPRGREGLCEWVQVVAASTGLPYIEQRLEMLEELDSVKVTVSVYGKVSASTLTVTPFVRQNFGAGGSTEVLTNGTAWTWDTTLKRFSATFTVPSITGKTIGPGAYTAFGWSFPAAGATFTVRFGWAQCEVGEDTTPFSLPDRPTELLRAQRFYFKTWNPDTPILTVTQIGAVGADDGGNSVESLNISFPVPMRTTPAITWVSPASGAVGKIERPIAGGDATVTATPFTGARTSGFPITGAVGAGQAAAHLIADARL